MNKLISGLLALFIYLTFIYLILLSLKTDYSKYKTQNSSQRVTITLVNSNEISFIKKDKEDINFKPKLRSQKHIKLIKILPQ